MIQKLYIRTSQIQQKSKMEKKSEFNEVCEECKKEDESVKQNLVMYSYKICDSCKLSKTIFPI